MIAVAATFRSFADQLIIAPWTLARGIVRALALAGSAMLALCDAAMIHLTIEPSGGCLARARAAWLHRWARVFQWVLGLRAVQQGFAPVSGIIMANHTSLIDAILLASIRECVFVAGDEVRRLPLIGLLARLGGTIVIDRTRRHDAARVNFMIQRALGRRLLVVIFPECGSGPGIALGTFASALFQPAVELRCTLTAAGISYHLESKSRTDTFALEISVMRQLLRLLIGRRLRATIGFSTPALRLGDRKRLARALRGEVLELKLRAAEAAR